MKLIFVYNADSGLPSALLDIGHKIISPDTYSCNLCKLTFDTFKESAKWKKFKESSSHVMEFLHKDEFEEKYGTQFEYPVILKEEDGILKEAVSKEFLDSLNSLDELIETVSKL